MLSVATLQRQMVDDPIIRTKKKNSSDEEVQVAEGERDRGDEVYPCIEQLNKSTGEVMHRYKDRFEAMNSMNFASSKGIDECVLGKINSCQSFKWRVSKVPHTPGAKAEFFVLLLFLLLLLLILTHLFFFFLTA